jgi:hypothetical protein
MSSVRARGLARLGACALAVAAALSVSVAATPAHAEPTGSAPGFAVTDFFLPAVPEGGSVAQSVAGLWFGSTATTYTKTGGDSWLSVSAGGLVTGTAPPTAPDVPGLITVEASDGTTTSDIAVEVPVLSTGQRPQIETASWNLDGVGTGDTRSEQAEVRAIVASGIDILGLQGTAGTAATTLAHDLGWHSYQSSGDLGIVSAYPITDVTEPTAATPAAGATLHLAGQDVRIWTADLDDTDYGPYRACFDGVTGSALVADEKAATRYAQATAIAAEMRSDLAAGQTMPVVLLGDLASPSATDWTAATSAAHCGVGPVSWPVPAVFADAGLGDSYRVASADPVADPGVTWSPLVTTNAAQHAPEPQDRIDYVDYAGPLQVLGSESLYTGWAGSAGDVGSDWPTDHAAVVTLFQVAGVFDPGTTVIEGTPEVGSTLHVDTSSWVPQPHSYLYRWYADGRLVAGGPLFTPTSAMAGEAITAQITGTGAGYASLTVTTPPVTVVAAGSGGGLTGTGPVRIASTLSAEPNANGWYHQPVTVAFTCTPGAAALAGPCPAPVTVSTDGTGQVVTGTVSDTAGTSSTTSAILDLDQTPPTVSVVGVSAGAIYPGLGPRPTCSARDALSGVASCTLVVTRSGDVATVTATAVDQAGNVGRTTLAYRTSSAAPTVTTYRGVAGLPKGATLRFAGKVVKGSVLHAEPRHAYSLVLRLGSGTEAPRYFAPVAGAQQFKGDGRPMKARGAHRFTLQITPMPHGLRAPKIAVSLDGAMHVFHVR